MSEKNKSEDKKTIRLSTSTIAVILVIITVAFVGVGFLIRGYMPMPTGRATAKPREGSAAQGDGDVAQLVADLKQEVKCNCGCGLTLEDCEVYDPSCSVRPGIISRVEELAQEGKTKEDIIGLLKAPTQTSKTQTAKTKVSLDDDPSKGSDNAPVTIIEFSDYQCPYCARFWRDTLPQIEEEYIETGKVKFVYRDFPLGFHQYAQKAAEAAECADEQGNYWDYHDKLFENQNALDTASLKQYAKDLGLDTAKFNDCLDSGKYASEVQKDFEDGQAAGVTGTPAFFINGQSVVGAQPFSAFKQVIDAELVK